MSTSPRTGMPSTVSWPEMGGATAHPTGATLALGDPSVSLNAPQRSRGYHRLQGVPGLAPWVAVWLVHVPVAAAGAATEFGQDSGMRSGLPCHRGSTAVAFCLTAVSVPESMEALLRNQNTENGLGGMGVVVPWPWVVAVWPRGGTTEEAPKRLVDAGQPLLCCWVGQQTP